MDYADASFSNADYWDETDLSELIPKSIFSAHIDSVKIISAMTSNCDNRYINCAFINYKDNPVAIFSLDSNDFLSGKRLNHHRIKGKTFYSCSKGNRCNMVLWRKDNKVKAIVSKMDIVELMSCAERLYS